MSLTVSRFYAIPSLIGRGLTEEAARTALANARVFGTYPAHAGLTVIPVTFANGKYTIGEAR